MFVIIHISKWLVGIVMPSDEFIITVCGETFTLSSSDGEEYVKELATYVNGKLEQINRARGGSFLRPSLRSALLALNIADDFFKKSKDLRLKTDDLEARLSSEQKQKRELIKENQRLREQNKKLKAEIDRYQAPKQSEDKL